MKPCAWVWDTYADFLFLTDGFIESRPFFVFGRKEYCETGTVLYRMQK